MSTCKQQLPWPGEALYCGNHELTASKERKSSKLRRRIEQREYSVTAKELIQDEVFPATFDSKPRLSLILIRFFEVSPEFGRPNGLDPIECIYIPNFFCSPALNLSKDVELQTSNLKSKSE